MPATSMEQSHQLSEALTSGKDLSGVESYLAQEVHGYKTAQTEVTGLYTRISYMEAVKKIFSDDPKQESVLVNVLEDGTFYIGQKDPKDESKVIDWFIFDRSQADGYFGEALRPRPMRVRVVSGITRAIKGDYEGPTHSNDQERKVELEEVVLGFAEKISKDAERMREDLITYFIHKTNNANKTRDEKDDVTLSRKKIVEVLSRKVVSRIALLDAVKANFSGSGHTAILDPESIFKAPARIEGIIHEGLSWLVPGQPVVTDTYYNPFHIVISKPRFEVSKEGMGIDLAIPLLTIAELEDATTFPGSKYVRRRQLQQLAEKVLTDSLNASTNDIFPDKFGWDEVFNKLAELSGGELLNASLRLAILSPNFAEKRDLTEEVFYNLATSVENHLVSLFRDGTNTFSPFNEEPIPPMPNAGTNMGQWVTIKAPFIKLGALKKPFNTVLSAAKIDEAIAGQILDRAKVLRFRFMDNADVNQRAEKFKNHARGQILNAFFGEDLPNIPKPIK